MAPRRGGGGSRAFDLLASLTARLASTASAEEIATTVTGEIVSLGFGAVWIAVLDEPTGSLVTVREVIDGRDTSHEMPVIPVLDMRQPIGRGFQERRMINIQDPESLLIIEELAGPPPGDRLALPRVIYQHLRGHPFACGPLLGSRGQPVGAIGLSSYRGQRPIPDELFHDGLLVAFMQHLGIAMERALFVRRLERLNARLVAAQESLIKTARMQAVGELTAAIAHDLNNLCGLVSVGQASPEAAQAALPRIERANRAIGDLVARLQQVARTGAAPSPGPLDLARLIDDVLLMLAPMCREESIRVETHVPAAAQVIGDPTELQQILVNLLFNARDALREVEPERRLIRLEVEVRGQQVQVRVIDGGPGFAPDMLDRAFEPFATSKGQGHAGLGLTTVASAVKHFGGGVAARNLPGGGAAVELLLTRAEPPAAPARPPAAGALPGALSFLAVDDEQEVVDIITLFLESRGHEVVGTTAAAEAASLARSRSFDVILCDVGMPGQNGLDLCRALRNDGVTSKLVLMTGWDHEVVLSDARATSCDGVLKKPFMGDQIDRMIAGLLGGPETSAWSATNRGSE